MVSEGDRLTKELDQRGRFYIGTALAEREVTVEIVDVEEDEEEGDDAPSKVTLCEECGEVWAGLRTFCEACEGESVRQVEPRTEEGSA